MSTQTVNPVTTTQTGESSAQASDTTKINLSEKSLLLGLVSTELDSGFGGHSENCRQKFEVHPHILEKGNYNRDEYSAVLKVPVEFGEVGAVVVENEYNREIFIKNIVLKKNNNNDIVIINCNSWVHSKLDNPHEKRIFFANKSYLPSETPNGLKELRKKELEILRGDGQGERKRFDRIYDYDVYNDLGIPADTNLKRPVLGGEIHHYPRRCRTGRKTKDGCEEKGVGSWYIPRDESFSKLNSALLNLKVVEDSITKIYKDDYAKSFASFEDIHSLFENGLDLSGCTTHPSSNFLQTKHTLKFQTPDGNDWKSKCLSDKEFGRQTLAGVNPYSIRLVTEWPLKSKLDPLTYGNNLQSTIGDDVIKGSNTEGYETLEKAMQEKRLFMLDYHDLLLPYVEKVKEHYMHQGRTLYASRTLFFLTGDGTLTPLAIELSRPGWKHVYRPSEGENTTKCWLWRLAKAHVLAHDSSYHQVVSHWLRTHCVTEPYIIAMNRQLSAMHPIYRLLHPHFRHTMEINVLARQKLINAGGVIERTFSLGKYALELSSDAYKQWRFDKEALPQDLIDRGLAEKDETADHGLKLRIEDYPFAKDGLDLWFILKKWVTDYVNVYYKHTLDVVSVEELNEWWTEIKNKGHADKKFKSWWPKLENKDNLIEILTTIIWVTSGHHAAVNFGQYTYAGYFPHRPTIARTNIPSELKMTDGEVELMKCFPSKFQAVMVTTVLNILSNHFPDEEYLGKKTEPSWEEDERVKKAFKNFQESLDDFDKRIDERNGDEKLKNRFGIGAAAYKLLKPFSEAGVTGKGVPYSISI